MRFTWRQRLRESARTYAGMGDYAREWCPYSDRETAKVWREEFDAILRQKEASRARMLERAEKKRAANAKKKKPPREYFFIGQLLPLILQERMSCRDVLKWLDREGFPSERRCVARAISLAVARRRIDAKMVRGTTKPTQLYQWVGDYPATTGKYYEQCKRRYGSGD